MSISMLKGIHRRMLGISKDDQVIAPYGFAAGGDGKPAVVFPGPDTVAVFDDFNTRQLFGINDTGTGVVGNLDHHKGLYFRWIATDTGNDVKLLDTGGVNGVLRIGPVNDGTQTPAGTNTSLVGYTTGAGGPFWSAPLWGAPQMSR